MSRTCVHSVWLCAVGMALVVGGCSNSPPITVNLMPSSPQALDEGQTASLTATVANDPSNRGVVWSLSGPGTLSATAGFAVTYNAPTTSFSSAQQATSTATSVANSTKSATLQITVNPYLQVPFQTLPNGSVGAPYNQPITFMGGTAPFQWSIYNGPIPTGWRVGGSVPPGLTLNASTGVISGTPSEAGTWYFER